MKTKRKTAATYLLILVVAFEAIGSIYGGISLIKDPSGSGLKMPITFLEGTMFTSYLIPGIILFLLLGFFPLFLIFPLIYKPNWPIINVLNIYKGYHWAWTYTVYTAIMVIIWINVEMMILSTGSIIQGTFGLLGVLILILTLSPGVKRYYKLQNHSRHSSIANNHSNENRLNGTANT